MKDKKYTIIIAERGTGKKIAEATALYEMYRHYIHKVREFNTFNDIVFNVSKFQSHRNISDDIPVDREMFDKLYEGAINLKLHMGLTYNEDDDIWLFSVDYRGTKITFLHSDN